jgi:hypothetical protein
MIDAAAEIDATAPPAPASEVRCVFTSDEERVSAALQRRREQRTPAQRHAIAAAALYGDDPDRVLQAIAAGTHPLQRDLDAAALERSRQLAVEGNAVDAAEAGSG